MDRRELLGLLGSVGTGFVIQEGVLHAAHHGASTAAAPQSPMTGPHAHFCGIHVAKNNPRFQLIAQHYCTAHAGIPIKLEGILNLSFAPNVDVQSQVGGYIQLFDWSAVSASGAFGIQSPHVWDTSRLYTTGTVRLLSATTLPGDFNGNGLVDAADFVVWRKGLGTEYTQADYDVWRANFGRGVSSSSISGDFNLDGSVDAADYIVWRRGLGNFYTHDDYEIWRANFGKATDTGVALAAAELLSAGIPEPETCFMLLTAIALTLTLRYRLHDRTEAPCWTTRRLQTHMVGPQLT